MPVTGRSFHNGSSGRVFRIQRLVHHNVKALNTVICSSVVGPSLAMASPSVPATCARRSPGIPWIRKAVSQASTARPSVSSSIGSQSIEHHRPGVSVAGWRYRNPTHRSTRIDTTRFAPTRLTPHRDVPDQIRAGTDALRSDRAGRRKTRLDEHNKSGGQGWTRASSCDQMHLLRRRGPQC